MDAVKIKKTVDILLYRVGHKKLSPILFCLKCYCICLYGENDTPYKLPVLHILMSKPNVYVKMLLTNNTIESKHPNCIISQW